MLGDLIMEERGRLTGRRVLPSDGGPPKVEVSFQAVGKVLGLDSKSIGTYWSVVRPDGSLYGEGQGVVMTASGDMASWVGQGAGKFRADGGVSWRGALYHQTASAKLARLNGVATIFEYEADGNDNTESKLWEWK